MNRRVLLYLVAAVVVIGVGAVAYILLSGGSGQASEPISAPTLSLDEATATPEMTAAPTDMPTEAAATALF